MENILRYMKAEDIIENDNELLNLPLKCENCDSEIDRENGNKTLLKLDENRNPLCEKHSGDASELVTAKRVGGYVNNGLHPETGDPIDIDSTSWLEIVDTNEIN